MHQYEYDAFYRLKTAKAVYQGEFTKASYELNMGYNNLHNITNKNLVHTVNNEQKGYVLDYNYDNEQHPNAPSSINEVTQATTGGIRNYVYDGNGNPTSYTEQQSFRKMSWDEENRLMGINDTGRMHQYTYDAAGERVIKSSGDSQNVAVNGQTAATIVHTNDYTGYVSPYFVISKGKFTKHYFEGAGRIVSKLGNGAFAQPLGITAGGVNYTQRTAEQQMALDAYVRTLGVPPGPPTQQGIYATPEFTGDPYPSDALKAVEENQEPPEGWPRNPVFNAPGDVPGPPVQFGDPVKPSTVRAGEGFTGIGLPEKDIFYFHPDHLGSTSYISSGNGSISQHVEYIAFGEILFEEHSSSFSSPYLFNGKELDRETNLSYYGARYLDMKTSLWLSVDPLAEKILNYSPYNFVRNNPINRIDPDGRTDYRIDGETQNIDDGHNDLVVNVTQKQFDKLQNKFNKSVSGYESYMNKVSIQNGYTTSNSIADGSGNRLNTIEIISHKAGGDSYQQWSDSKDDSNMKSGSAIVGYEGALLSKAEILIKIGAKGESFSNLRHVSKALQMTKYAGRGLGVLGTGLSVIEDINSNNVGWGTGAKVGIGTLLLGASAPVALTCAVLDVGWGLATGTTITDNVANYVNEKTK
ncbi:RHS repeat domain-containing protein [Flavobacterium crassostreae]|uniref:Teneurin-like YD-shell domain-containing protein n=1 Tax=Flavobacterium crassostreae TaxID=1763534 RepID=A0A1B9DLB3_9FLAO|nr:RHS repeat-associated core domain-containing protein [Flavobacterium crassostreae]OCB70433.1 hypothetical protein LPBF_12015 [Flavobacterium crassostreae]